MRGSAWRRGRLGDSVARGGACRVVVRPLNFTHRYNHEQELASRRIGCLPLASALNNDS